MGFSLICTLNTTILTNYSNNHQYYTKNRPVFPVNYYYGGFVL